MPPPTPPPSQAIADAAAAAKTKDQMKCGFLLDVIVGQRTPVLQLLSGKYQTLLIKWDSQLVLNLGLDVLDRI